MVDRIELEWIRSTVASGEYEFSSHADKERQADRIPISDVERALLHAELLEDYPDDPRGPSCLVLGFGELGYPIHIVCGRTPKGTLRITTVYLPILPKWMDPRTRVKRG